MLSPQLMENSGMVLDIYHAPSKESVKFRAWLTNFSDSYDQNWNEEDVFGRMDAHQVYKSTRRRISVGWKVLAEDIAEAKVNMQKISLLAQMQYPTYSDSTNGGRNLNSATSIQGSPIFRLKFLNWIQDVDGPGPSAPASTSGLVGRMSGFTFEPNLDAGVFHNDANLSVADEASQYEIYAREMQISFDYFVLHTHNLGYLGRNKRKSTFPYGESTDNISPPQEFTIQDQLVGNLPRPDSIEEEVGDSATDNVRSARTSILEGE